MKALFLGLLLIGIGIFLIRSDAQKETLARLKQTHALKWSEEEQKKYPQEYAVRREHDLPTIPLIQWSSDEKHTNPVVFLTILLEDLKKSSESLKEDLDHWDKELADARIREARAKAQLEKIIDNLTAGIKLRKAGKYPAQFQGTSLSQDELAELLISLNELKTRKDEEVKACSMALDSAKKQITLKKRLLEEQRNRISSCQASLQRAKNGERIEDMNQLLAQIDKGISAAEQLDEGTREILEDESINALGQEQSNEETLLSLEEEFL